MTVYIFQGELILFVSVLLQKSDREDRPERVRRVRVREPVADVPGGLRVTRVRLGILPHQVSPIPPLHSISLSPAHPQFVPKLNSFFRQSIEVRSLLDYSRSV